MKKKIAVIHSVMLSGPLLVSTTGCSGEKNHELTNVIFILADDIGPGDIAVYHRERTGKPEVIKTPNIDDLAVNGIRFRDAHTPAGLSAPTRYSIMTGNNSYRCRNTWGIWGGFEPRCAVAPGEKSVANVMEEAGYHTAFFGKWNMGGKFNRKDSATVYPGSEKWDDGWDYSEMVDAYPNKIGFDYSFTLPQGIQTLPFAIYENGKWYPISKESFIRITDNPWKKGGSNAKGDYIKGDSEWETSKIGAILNQKAVDFIKDHVKQKSKEPFFIYYCSQAVHGPHEPPVSFSGTPVKGTTQSNHGDMIVELDLQVGKIVETLKESGIYENTLIIFTSDNGGLNTKQTNINGHHSSNGFRAQKGSMYEGGTRVPFIASWPKGIPAGKTSDEPVMAHDLMATMYALTGQDMPDDQGMDSYNILPLLLDEPGARGREKEFYQGGLSQPVGDDSYKFVYRDGNWKLIINTNSKGEILDPFAFFNLKDNPFEDESKNLINDPVQQERIKEMYDYYKKIRTTRERTTPAFLK